jgi:CHAT domain-containing protein
LLSFLYLRHQRREPQISRIRAELIAVAGPSRLLPGRLIGDDYAPFSPAANLKSSEQFSLLLPDIRQPISVSRGDDERAGGDATDRALLAIFTDRLPAAAAIVEATAQETPVDARQTNDLSALYLALAARTRDPYYFFLALASAERAIQADGLLLEARFNRALALEGLAVDWEAQAAWKDYRARDPESGWGQEALDHLQRLRAPISISTGEETRSRLDAAALAGKYGEMAELVRRDPQTAREYAEQDLLGSWGEAFLQNRPDAAHRSLDIARRIGTALSAWSGDQMLTDSVAAIDKAGRELRADRLDTLAAGHLAYRQALQAGLDVERSLRLLLTAERHLIQGRSPFSAWAALQRAICEFRQSQYDSALAILQELDNGTDPLDLTLRARALRVRGMIQATLADYSRAVETFSSAAALYQQTHEVSHLVDILTLLATTQQFMGNPPEAWRTRCRALRLARQLPVRPYLLLGETAGDAFCQGQPRIALYFLNEGLRIAEQLGDAATLAEGLRLRAEVHLRLGQEGAAETDLRQAKVSLDLIPSQDIRRNLRGDILAIEGQMAARRDPGKAVGLLKDALAIYEDTHYHLFLSQLYQKTAQTYLALGDDVEAEAHYKAAITERERQRAMLPDEPLRTAFFDDVQPVFAEMAFFELVHRQKADHAFDYTERARARALLDLLQQNANPGGVQPLASEAIRQALPANTVVVAYTVLSEHTLAWVIQRDSLHAALLRVGSRSLTQMVRDLRGESAGRPRDSDLSTRLYRELMSPLMREVPAGARLVIVPDQCLSKLPFALLRSPETGRYLIEDHAFSVAPSATVFISSLHRDGLLWRAPEVKVLIVGDPASPGLAVLPGVEREMAAVRRIYGAGRITELAGPSATREAFLAALPEHDIIHFAGHALIDPVSPQKSQLVLAGGGAANGLRMGELFGRPLPRTRLVVLSGCSTGAGRLSASEGPLSLARPFLSDGVPAVVASLWNVDDSLAERLFTLFHEHLRSGLDAVSVRSRPT